MALLSDWKQLIAAFTFEIPCRQLSDKGVVADVTRRDGGKCCITGLSNSFWDPLVVAPILPRQKAPVDKVAAASLNLYSDRRVLADKRLPQSLHGILCAFVGPELRDWILSNEASQNACRNHWLVRKSAATAFSQGFFQFTFTKVSNYHVAAVRIGGPEWPSIMDKTPLLRHGSFTDHSSSSMDTPDVSALQLLSQFAKPIRWNHVAREMAGKKPQAVTSLPLFSPCRFFSEHGATALIIAWRMVPTSIRIRAYHGLAFLGAHIYGANCSLKVQQLPFGIYLKRTSVEWHEGLANEYGALQLVRRHTCIPVPHPLDLASNSEESYLLTCRVPGHRLGMCIDTLSDDEANTLLYDLQKCLTELRAIPKEVAPEYAITNALGKACYDYRINAGLDYDEDRGDFVGPFVSEEEFNETLKVGALPNTSHRSGHKIVFTHGDLNMRNVLVRDGRLSGIVDWENAGWYPEYWEYTKAHYITKLKRRWLRIVDELFKEHGDFEEELATEHQLWSYCF
ncbi:Uncharacterized protein TPAR_07550 [Tolypocladium paradoxum]|uniref:Aminoglycoside phosphotransferase domain-containing protein n=1 Tax=Tolypocladium paradoxum TaxID=94208 RepID=A0A2S4KPW8_9HYPO|nr:Uncharacterized protein TPAR_07550 [Tolypocladium paradoxum]